MAASLRRAVGLVLVAGALAALPGPACAAKAKRPPASESTPTRCPTGSAMGPEGTCSRCEATVIKGRDGCGDTNKACVKRCDGAYQKCLRDPRALDCDKAQEKCAATCDKARSACFASKEKAYQDCRAKEGKKR